MWYLSYLTLPKKHFDNRAAVFNCEVAGASAALAQDHDWDLIAPVDFGIDDSGIDHTHGCPPVGQVTISDSEHSDQELNFQNSDNDLYGDQDSNMLNDGGDVYISDGGSQRLSGGASCGTGPETSGTGPETSGTGPETSGTGPETSGTGPETSGTPCISGKLYMTIITELL